MNISIPVSWLREYVKTDLTAKSIANYLSLSGPSVEKIDKFGNDYIYDIEITTNRPDSSSVFGIAREANTIILNEGKTSKLIQPKGINLSLEPDTSTPLKLDVVIKNPNLCHRFTAVVLDNIKIQDSPAIIKNRLNKVGIRAINNIVDITNYLMVELAQPMHAFDYDKIIDSKMLLRASREGETIKTLDGVKRNLPTGSIVIEDKNRLIDLCGIMGAENSQINRRTKRVVLFVQSYNKLTIRKTSQALSFRTDASSRFEKGVDRDFIPQALSRAVYLVKKTTKARIASDLVDIYIKKQRKKKIELSFTNLNSYLGIDLKKEQVQSILVNLGFEINSAQDKLTATPPSWRAEDIEEEVDLIEEIARVYGYWRLPSKLPSGIIPSTDDNYLLEAQNLKKQFKHFGLTEVISYSIVSEDYIKLSGFKSSEVIELANPLTNDWQFMRPTLILSLAEVIAKNQNFKEKIKIFEIAKTFIKKRQSLPQQDLNLTIALSDSSFYEIKGLLENIFSLLGKNIKWEKLKTTDQIFENSQTANLIYNKELIGSVGILSQNIKNQLGINSNTAIAEVNLSNLDLKAKPKLSYKPIPKHPPLIEDISAIFSQNVPVEDIISMVKETGYPLVNMVQVIDVYRDQNIGEDKKSVALRITYQKKSATPTQEEVNQVKDKIVKSIQKNLLAKVRS